MHEFFKKRAKFLDELELTENAKGIIVEGMKKNEFLVDEEATTDELIEKLNSDLKKAYKNLKEMSELMEEIVKLNSEHPSKYNWTDAPKIRKQILHHAAIASGIQTDLREQLEGIWNIQRHEKDFLHHLLKHSHQLQNVSNSGARFAKDMIQMMK